MQISKLASGKNKNFRIQLKTQLSSKQKQKNRSQSQQIKDNCDNINIKNDDFCLNLDYVKKPKRSVSIISLLNHAKVTDYNQNPSKLRKNAKKLPLTLTSKQKLLIVNNRKIDQKTKNRSLISDKNALALKELKQNSFSDQKQNLPELNYFVENIFYMVQNQTNLINRKKNQKLSLSQKNLYEDKLIKKEGQKIKQIQINQQILNSSCQKLIQKDFLKIENLSWQEQFQNVFLKKFKISNQFSLSLNNSQNGINRKSVGTQADIIFPTQDKYFLQYVRYRELKVKHYEQVQQKQAKIKKMIEESLQFANHYQLFNDSINEPPFTDREKRVFYLGKQLQTAQLKVKEAISKVHKLQKQSETYLQRIIPEMQHKKQMLFVSIMNLTQTFLLEKQKQQDKEDRKAGNKNQQQMRKQKTYCNILKRVLNQFRYLKKLDAKKNQTINTVLGQYQQEVKQFQKSYIEWSGLYYESRVLIYNFMRQIQKIPEIMIELFGFRSKQDTEKSFCPEQQFDEYMSAKCQICYHTNKKVKFLQATNEQIKPILKSVEWLIRDMSKKRTCISII